MMTTSIFFLFLSLRVCDGFVAGGLSHSTRPRTTSVVSMAPEEMMSELGFELGRAVIAWGVPLTGIFLVGQSLSGNKKMEEMEDDVSLEFGLDDSEQRQSFPPFLKPPSRKNRQSAPSYLKIERLNARLESFEYDLVAATEGRARARKVRRRSRLRTAFGDEFREILDDLTENDLDTIAEAEKKYVKSVQAAKKSVGESEAMLRSEAFASDKQNSTKGKMMKMMGGSHEKEVAEATKAKAKAEVAFMKEISKIIPENNTAARQRIEQLVRSARAEDDDVVAAVLDSVPQKGDSSSPSRVYVLEFIGDVQASQVAQLRQEVTAILGFAESGRDEVVLKLQTGGGTVTGYGLAAAQLCRIKDAGLKLTICVEQVAASGGYMMACCADHIVASPFAVLGSIGVISDVPNAFERLQREGIEFQTVTAGKYKRTLTPFKKVTKEDVAKQKDDLEDILKLFKGFVKSNRPQLDIEDVATGETWFGDDALEKNLCDELKSFDDVALEKFKSGADVFSVKYREPKEVNDISSFLPAAAAVDLLATLFLKRGKDQLQLEDLLSTTSNLLAGNNYEKTLDDDLQRTTSSSPSQSYMLLDKTPRPRFEYRD